MVHSGGTSRAWVKGQQTIADGASSPGQVWLEDTFVYLIAGIKDEPGF